MSNRSVLIQEGPPEICTVCTRYAFWISARSVTLVAVKRPPGNVLIASGPGPDGFGLMDATSNSMRGGGCAETRRPRAATSAVMDSASVDFREILIMACPA